MPAALQFLDVEVISPTRIRLAFSDSLDPATYGSALTSYAVTGAAASPQNPIAMFAIPGANVVELAFDPALPAGIPLTVSQSNVFASGATTPLAPGSIAFHVGAPTTAKTPNVEVVPNNAELTLYGRDLVWTGSDYEETVTGDLSRVSGVANVQAALYRRLTGDPLPWAPGYSPRARDFVDGNDVNPLRARVLRQALRDDRVQQVTCVVNFGADATATLAVTFSLRGGEKPPALSVAIEN